MENKKNSYHSWCLQVNRLHKCMWLASTENLPLQQKLWWVMVEMIELVNNLVSQYEPRLWLTNLYTCQVQVEITFKFIQFIRRCFYQLESRSCIIIFISTIYSGCGTKWNVPPGGATWRHKATQDHKVLGTITKFYPKWLTNEETQAKRYIKRRTMQVVLP